MVNQRNESHADITIRLYEICNSIEMQLPETQIHKKYLSGTKFISVSLTKLHRG